MRRRCSQRQRSARSDESCVFCTHAYQRVQVNPLARHGRASQAMGPAARLWPRRTSSRWENATSSAPAHHCAACAASALVTCLLTFATRRGCCMSTSPPISWHPHRLHTRSTVAAGRPRVLSQTACDRDGAGCFVPETKTWRARHPRQQRSIALQALVALFGCVGCLFQRA